MTSSFMLQCTPSTRSCNYLNLPVLLSVNNVLCFFFGRMFNKINKWHVWVWIVIDENQQWIDSFWNYLW